MINIIKLQDSASKISKLKVLNITVFLGRKLLNIYVWNIKYLMGAKIYLLVTPYQYLM